MDESSDTPHRPLGERLADAVVEDPPRRAPRKDRRPHPRAAGAFTPEQVAAIQARADALGYRTPTALARAVGVKHPTVIRWFSGERAPRLSHLMDLAQALELPWPTDFLGPAAGVAPHAAAAGPSTSNVYGTTREVYAALGYPLRPVYRTGTRLDLTRVGASEWPLPVAERPMPPENARELGPEAFVLLQGGNAMAGRRPEEVADGDYWWIVPVARRAPRPGDLVAVRMEEPPPDGEEGGVLLRSYDVDPETGAPVLHAEPAVGVRLPVRGRWTVLGVALFAETIRPARHDS